MINEISDEKLSWNLHYCRYFRQQSCMFHKLWSILSPKKNKEFLQNALHTYLQQDQVNILERFIKWFLFEISFSNSRGCVAIVFVRYLYFFLLWRFFQAFFRRLPLRQTKKEYLALWCNFLAKCPSIPPPPPRIPFSW